ncbi:MAG: hypothetical protein WBL50_12435 [Candidatus Acidiferrum sp.]
MRFNRDSIAALVATAAVVLVVALGFWKTRGPSTQRLLRTDEKRIQNVSQLANEINQRYQLDKHLPEKLSDFQRTRYADPITGKTPDYTVKSATDYMLCTEFVTDGSKEGLNGALAFWKHSKGSKCFEFHATEPVPPAPYFYR